VAVEREGKREFQGAQGRARRKVRTNRGEVTKTMGNGESPSCVKVPWPSFWLLRKGS